MSKKMIIISIASVLVVAGATTAAIILLRGNPIPPAPIPTTTETPALSVDTPEYKACSVIGIAAIKDSFGSNVSSISDAKVKATSALNGEVAEECSYTFKTNKSDNNTFAVQVYQTSALARDTDVMPMGDETWFVIANITIPQTALYKSFETKDTNTRTYLLNVMTPTRYFMYSIVQPLDTAAIDDAVAMDILAKLANAGDYTVPELENAPPAPVVN